MDNNLKKKLIALFHVFKDKPHMLADYLETYDAFSENFKNIINNSSDLSKIAEQLSNDETLEKPYFNNIEEMKIYYNNLFDRPKHKNDNKHPVLGVTTQEDALKMQLLIAIELEDYEKAAKIRDYMIQLGYINK
jgi:hypothetical protein